MPKHLILILMIQIFTKVKQFADRNEKLVICRLNMSGGVTPLHPTVGTGLLRVY